MPLSPSKIDYLTRLVRAVRRANIQARLRNEDNNILIDQALGEIIRQCRADDEHRFQMPYANWGSASKVFLHHLLKGQDEGRFGPFRLTWQPEGEPLDESGEWMFPDKDKPSPPTPEAQRQRAVRERKQAKRVINDRTFRNTCRGQSGSFDTAATVRLHRVGLIAKAHHP